MVDDTTRGPEGDKLKATAESYLAFSRSDSPAFAHIEAAERQMVAKEAQAALDWLSEKVALQSKLTKSAEPVLVTNDISKKRATLDLVVKPIVGRPAPKKVGEAGSKWVVGLGFVLQHKAPAAFLRSCSMAASLMTPPETHRRRPRTSPSRSRSPCPQPTSLRRWRLRPRRSLRRWTWLMTTHARGRGAGEPRSLKTHELSEE
jgi:hypothetical protein